MSDNPFPPIDPLNLPDQEHRLVDTAARVTHLRRRRRALTAGLAVAAILAVVLPLTLAGGSSPSQGVQVIGEPATTSPASGTVTTAPPSPTTTTSPTRGTAAIGPPSPTTTAPMPSPTSGQPTTGSAPTTLPPTTTPPPTTAPPTLPEVIFDCTAPPPSAQQSKVKPSSIVLACADNGIGVQDLAWSNWTTTTATGTGKVWENTCTPNCAQGTFGYYPATITLSGVVNTPSNGYLFSQLTALYQSTGPNGHTSDHFRLPLPPE
jgi:hypothetical protein